MNILITNIPKLLLKQKTFNNNINLNQINPNKHNNTQNKLYIYQLFKKIIKKFNYLINLHTTNFKHINTYYIQTNISNKINSKITKLQNPKIILNHTPINITLKKQATIHNIKTITIKLQNPHLFQQNIINNNLINIKNILYNLKILPNKILYPTNKITLYNSSY